MKYVLELFSVLRMFLNYSKIVHSILCITSLSVPKNKVVYNSHLWIQIKFPFYYCLPFCFPPSHCLDIAWSGRPPPYIYIYILVEKLSCIYIYQGGSFLGIPVFHNKATVKWVSITKYMFWLSVNCVLTSGYIKVPILGKIRYL